MPNWCYNILSATGERDALDTFIETCRNKRKDDNHDTEHETLSFDSFIPLPKGEWEYDWCVENWGTKWDACYPHLTDDGGKDIQYSFDTAWSPPAPVVYRIIKNFPSIEFYHYYEEPGMGFQGEIRGKNGEVTYDLCEDWHPECIQCSSHDYPHTEMEYDDGEYAFICPKCYVESNEIHEWDREENE